MNKLLSFLIFFVFIANISKSEIPDYESSDLNKNLTEYGWKVIRTNFLSIKGFPMELYTLSKNGYSLKCQVTYFQDRLETHCLEP